MTIAIDMRITIQTVHVKAVLHAIMLVVWTRTAILQPLPRYHCNVILQFRREVGLERAIRPNAVDLLEGRW